MFYIMNRLFLSLFRIFVFWNEFFQRYLFHFYIWCNGLIEASFQSLLKIFVFWNRLYLSCLCYVYIWFKGLSEKGCNWCFLKPSVFRNKMIMSRTRKNTTISLCMTLLGLMLFLFLIHLMQLILKQVRYTLINLKKQGKGWVFWINHRLQIWIS